MAWSKKAKPTPANIRRRIKAAREAIQAATFLAAQHPSLAKPLRAPLATAHSWLDIATERTRKG